MKQQKMREQHVEDEAKRRRDWEREKKRHYVFETNEKIIYDRKMNLQHKLEIADQKVKKVQEDQEEQRRRKKDYEHLRNLDK